MCSYSKKEIKFLCSRHGVTVCLGRHLVRLASDSEWFFYTLSREHGLKNKPSTFKEFVFVFCLLAHIRALTEFEDYQFGDIEFLKLLLVEVNAVDVLKRVDPTLSNQR